MPDGDPAPTPEQHIAQLQADLRKERLGRILDAIKAPAAYADVYQGEVNQGAVEEFVKSLQVAPPAAPPAKDPPAGLNDWSAYESGAPRGGPPPASPTEHEKLLKDVSAHLDKLRVNKYRPSDDDDVEFSLLIERVNRVNREWERAIHTGAAQPAYLGNAGFGGRLDPPAYAYHALDRQN